MTGDTPKTFTETLYDGAVFQGFDIEKTHFEINSGMQQIGCYYNSALGNVLTLDGVIQTTESDEFAFHETKTHTALFMVENPKNVLILGAGDGGCLREVLKHPVEKVVMVEIDRQVVDLSNQYLPKLNNGGKIYEDPRVELVIADANDFMAKETTIYDTIILDSTDPLGVALPLFESKFFVQCLKLLRPGGSFAVHDGAVFLQNHVAETVKRIRELGIYAQCCITTVPTYYGGYFGLVMAINAPSYAMPSLDVLKARYAKLLAPTRHYTPEFHLASFVLPKWVDAQING